MCNLQRDMQVEQEFREVSNAITTRGNVFAYLVGSRSKTLTEMPSWILLRKFNLNISGKRLVERESVFTPEGSNPDAMKTSDSKYKILANHS